jgi:hypothetical protein
MAALAGIDHVSMWSLSKALADDDGTGSEYKRLMAVADRERQGSRDGRGSLSTEALIRFTEWFVGAMLAEVRRSRKIFDRSALSSRLAWFAEDLTGERSAGNLVVDMLRHDHVSAAWAYGILGGENDHMRRVMEVLEQNGVVEMKLGGDIGLSFGPASWDAVFPGLVT